MGPDIISDLQLSVRAKDENKYDDYAKNINGTKNGNLNPRSLFEIKHSQNQLTLKKLKVLLK